MLVNTQGQVKLCDFGVSVQVRDEWFWSEFLISSHGTSLAKRISYMALHSFLFGPYDAVNYDMILTALTLLLIGSRCIPNSHTLTIVESI